MSLTVHELNQMYSEFSRIFLYFNSVFDEAYLVKVTARKPANCAVQIGDAYRIRCQSESAAMPLLASPPLGWLLLRTEGWVATYWLLLPLGYRSAIYRLCYQPDAVILRKKQPVVLFSGTQ